MDAVGVPPLFGDDFRVAAESSGGEHDRLRVVLHHALVALGVRSRDAALVAVAQKAVHRGVEVQLHAQLVDARLHGLDVAHLGFPVLEPMERGEQASVVVVDRARVQNALLDAPIDVLGRLVHQIEPVRAVLAMLPACELGFDDVCRIDLDALLALQRRADGEHALDEACVASHLGVFLHEDEIRAVERRLHRAREPAAASAHDEQIGVVGLIHVGGRGAALHCVAVRARASAARRALAGGLGFLRACRKAARQCERTGRACPRQECATGHATAR